MCLIQTYNGHGIEPDEYRPGRPIPCTAHCGVIMDQDDDDIAYCDSDPYCNDCIDAARKAAYRPAIAAAIKEPIDKALDAIDAADKEYANPEENEAYGPYQMLDDVKSRIERSYIKGEDTGWRDGCMMDWAETHQLRMFLEERVASMAHHIKWSLDHRGEFPVSDFRMGEDAKLLATTARHLEDFKRYERRTQAGVRRPF